MYVADLHNQNWHQREKKGRYFRNIFEGFLILPDKDRFRVSVMVVLSIINYSHKIIRKMLQCTLL